MNRGLLRNNEIAIYVSIAVLLVTLIPLYVISHFNYPATDDFSFAYPLYWGLRENTAWWTIIKNAWDTVVHFYMTWQGRYFDVFMYTFWIGTAIPELYGMGTYLVLTLFVVATIWLIRVLTYKIMKWDSDISWIVALWFAIIQVWYVPHAVEAFYWFSGASAYTMTYALTLLLFTCLICYYNESQTRKKKTYAIFVILFSIMVAGSNYAIALLAAELYVVAIIVCIISKKKKNIFLYVSFVVYMCCFACSAFSPGNRTRLDMVDSLGVVGSIIASIKQAARFCVEWFHIPVFIFLVFIILLSFKQIVRMEYRFKLPAVVTVISFGLFASILTPPYYAGATWGPGRLINIEYYCYYFLLIGNMLYWIGWITHKWKKAEVPLPEKICLPTIVIAVCIIYLGCFKWYGLQSNNSTSALLSMVKGEAQQYRLENQERWKMYEDVNCPNMEAEDFSIKPYVLYYDDISADPSDWRNTSITHFFKKESLEMKE